MFEALISFVREHYRSSDSIPLHAPIFSGRERQYVVDTIDPTFVSSVGAYVDRFERDMIAYTGSPRAVATLNGTAALQFVTEPEACRSNYWLNAVVCDGRVQRDKLLKSTNGAGVMTRSIWALMNRLPAYAHCRQGPLSQAEWLEARVVNLPSSVLPQ